MRKYLLGLLVLLFLVGCDSPSAVPASRTATAEPTALAVAPTITRTHTPAARETAVPDPTSTSMPTEPAVTATPSPPPPTSIPCEVRTDWRPYEVAEDDTLAGIARREATLEQVLIEANCMMGTLVVTAGQTLYVPPTEPLVEGPDGPQLPVGEGQRSYSGSACFEPPFQPWNEILIDDTFKVEAYGADARPLYDSHDTMDTIGTIAHEQTAVVLRGAYCYTLDAENHEVGYRRWLVETAAGQVGWLEEYSTLDDGGWGVHLQPPFTVPEIALFEVWPNPALVTETVTVRWAVTEVAEVSLLIGSDELRLPAEGTHTFVPADVYKINNQVHLSVQVPDPNQLDYVFASETVDVIGAPALSIDSFSAVPSTAPSNGAVSLRWAISGEGSGYLFWFPNTWILTPITEVSAGLDGVMVDLPDRPAPITFRLELTDPNGLVVSRTLTVETTCPYTYFVSDPAVQADTCPYGPPRTGPGAYQAFENGFMVWEPRRHGGHKISAFVDDGRALGWYVDAWDGEPIVEIDTPPEGLLHPQRGFGQVWTAYEEVREALGWATAPEVSYTITAQQVDERATRHQVIVGASYVTLPDGRIVRYEAGTLGANLDGWVFLEE